MNHTPPRTWLQQDNVWLPDAQLPVTDRAVRYGMSVFETIGIRSGHPLFLQEHLTLLDQSAHALLPSQVGGAGVSGPLPPLEPNASGVLRLYLTAGDGTPSAPITAPRIFAVFEPRDATPLPDYQTTCLHPEPVHPFGYGYKTGNYWMNVRAQTAALHAGHDHAMLADHEDRLLSAAFGNLFFVLEGQLFTPASTLPVRSGVIKSWVRQQVEVEEIEFPAAELGEAEEVFLTNSRLGVMPLQFGSIAPGPVGSRLRDLLRRENLVP